MADDDRGRWTKLVADFESCDLSQREFATERGLSLSNLRYWIYKLRNESRPLRTEEPERSESAPKRSLRKRPSTLLPVEVVASAPKAREAMDAAMLEMVLPSGLRLRFPTGTDLHYLRDLAARL